MKKLVKTNRMRKFAMVSVYASEGKSNGAKACGGKSNKGTSCGGKTNKKSC